MIVRFSPVTHTRRRASMKRTTGSRRPTRRADQGVRTHSAFVTRASSRGRSRTRSSLSRRQRARSLPRLTRGKQQRARRSQSLSREKQIVFVLDSGASRHFLNSESLFDDPLVIFDVPVATEIADGTRIFSKSGGTSTLSLSRSGTDLLLLPLYDAVYSPSFTQNLLSLRALTEQGLTISFSQAGFSIIRDDTGQEIYRGKSTNGSYLIKATHHIARAAPAIETERLSGVLSREKGSLKEWHRRLGHLDVRKVIQLSNTKGSGVLITDRTPFVCDVCALVKSRLQPHPERPLTSFSTTPLEIVHSDIGYMNSTPSLSGMKYFLVFVDEATRFTHVYFLRKRSQAVDKLIEFHESVTVHKQRPISHLRLDRAGEFTDGRFKSYLKSFAIDAQFVSAGSHASNGLAERMILTLKTLFYTFLEESGLPMSMWAEACAHAADVHNMMPTPRLNKLSPWDKWFGASPPLKLLKPFGCLAYEHNIRPANTHSPKSFRRLFLGLGPLWFPFDGH